jgi:hypothetical protein
VCKRHPYPFITKGIRGKGGGRERKHWIGLNVSEKTEENIKNIQSAFRHTKIGNTRKVTIIHVSKSLYIIL